MRSPSFSRFSLSTTTTGLPAAISAIASSIESRRPALLTGAFIALQLSLYSLELFLRSGPSFLHTSPAHQLRDLPGLRHSNLRGWSLAVSPESGRPQTSHCLMLR